MQIKELLNKLRKVDDEYVIDPGKMMPYDKDVEDLKEVYRESFVVDPNKLPEYNPYDTKPQGYPDASPYTKKWYDNVSKAQVLPVGQQPKTTIAQDELARLLDAIRKQQVLDNAARSWEGGSLPDNDVWSESELKRVGDELGKTQAELIRLRMVCEDMLDYFCALCRMNDPEKAGCKSCEAINEWRNKLFGNELNETSGS